MMHRRHALRMVAVFAATTIGYLVTRTLQQARSLKYESLRSLPGTKLLASTDAHPNPQPLPDDAATLQSTIREEALRGDITTRNGWVLARTEAAVFDWLR